MTTASPAARTRQASQYLRELLSSDPYRRRWMRYGRGRERDVHQVSVAKVLAARLGEGPPLDGQERQQRLVHTVSRALKGQDAVLTRRTLDLFIDAFGFSAEHADALRRLWEGTDLPRVVVGDIPALDSTTPPPAPDYRTVLLHEFHYLGEDGMPSHHRTVRDIRALIDGLDKIRYSFDTGELRVERISGGTPGTPYRRYKTIWAVDITLPRTLNVGDEHTLEFETSFRYPGPVEPCFRRVAHERFENVAIRVQFHPRKLPERVWWAQWRDYRAPHDLVSDRRPAPLDREHAVYHRLDALDQSVVGFEWEFD